MKIEFTKEMLEAPLGEVFHTFKSKNPIRTSAWLRYRIAKVERAYEGQVTKVDYFVEEVDASQLTFKLLRLLITKNSVWELKWFRREKCSSYGEAKETIDFLLDLKRKEEIRLYGEDSTQILSWHPEEGL